MVAHDMGSTPARPRWRWLPWVSIVLLAIVAAGPSAPFGTSGPEVARADYRRPVDSPFPAGDPYTAAKDDLGRMLFYDPGLSATGTLSCASCHNPGLSYGNGLPLSVGVNGRTSGLRSPTLLNVAWIEVAGWDGKFPGIDAVNLAAIANPDIMGSSLKVVLDRLAASPGYVHAFATAYPGVGIDVATLRSALTTHVRTIVSGPAPFDRWVEGDEATISVSAKRGFALFNGRAGCAGCHSGWSFTDGSFHDIGVAGDDDLGRGVLFPNSVKLKHAFKVPTLRDVARRAPYMHNGSYPDLGSVIDLYDRGGIARPSLSELIHPLHLSATERADLLAFLGTLTSDPSPVAVPVIPRP